MKNILITTCAIMLLSCSNNKTQKSQGQWIKGSEEQQLSAIENQFRGFDMAMVETGYRYQELYWAGQDQNWDFADYQLEKIEKAIKNGLQRRPKRAKSANYFLTVTLPEMRKALQKRDSTVFNNSFQTLTNSCISCHAMEKLPSFIVKKPLHRQSPIRK